MCRLRTDFTVCSNTLCTFHSDTQKWKSKPNRQINKLYMCIILKQIIIKTNYDELALLMWLWMDNFKWKRKSCCINGKCKLIFKNEKFQWNVLWSWASNRTICPYQVWKSKPKRISNYDHRPLIFSSIHSSAAPRLQYGNTTVMRKGG